MTNLIIRVILLGINLLNVWYIIHLYEAYRLMMFFTNWTLLVTSFYFVLAIFAVRSRSLSLLATHHVIFEISFMMNIIVVVVFWSILYEEAIEQCEGHAGKIINVYTAHIVPGVSVFINFLITDVVVRATHVKMVVVIATMYGYVNYLEVKRTGQPLYWFLTWEDETTIYIFTALIVVFSGVFLGLATLTKIIKPRP
jgi:hypothetical protein